MKSYIVLLVTVFRFADQGFVTGKITEAEINGNTATIEPKGSNGVKHALRHGEWRLATEAEIASLDTPEAVHPEDPAPGDTLPNGEPVGLWDVDAGVYLDKGGAVIQPDTNVERERRGLPTLHVDPVTPPVGLTGEPETEVPGEDAPTGEPDASDLPDEGPAADLTEQPSASSEGEQQTEGQEDL